MVAAREGFGRSHWRVQVGEERREAERRNGGTAERWGGRHVCRMEQSGGTWIHGCFEGHQASLPFLCCFRRSGEICVLSYRIYTILHEE